MKKIKSLFLFLMLTCIYSIGYTQNKAIALNVKTFDKADKANLDKAEDFFLQEYYTLALPIYEDLIEKYPNETYLQYRLGMCYLKKQDAYDKAVLYLKPIAESDPDAADIKYFLGIAYHLTYQFDDAIKVFNEYLNQKIDDEQQQITKRLIENCMNAKMLVATPAEVTITNIGAPINSEASEYVPVISSDEQTMLFTYVGKKSKGGFEDIFISEKSANGQWKNPEPLGDNINGYNHDACIALSPDGQTLFIYKDSKEKKGEIYYSKLSGNSWSDPKPLLGEVNTNHWEGSASLSADGKTLYFTSDKPAGFGGRDIYKATLINDSIWGNIKNLGPTINTPYNDDAPFIHPDGRTLVFSSEGHNSMGGYDIFHTQLQLNGTWLPPTNIGFPINSPDRDTYYVLSADGKTGYFSSGRPGGYGLQDIYSVMPGLVGFIPTIAVVKGTITLNNQPAEAEIIVTIQSSEETHSKLGSNSVTGEYLTNLPKGDIYEVIYKLKDAHLLKLKGDSIVMELIAIENTDDFVEINKNIAFYTVDFESDIIVEEENIEEVYGDKSMDGLIFKVQIAAYNMPENYSYDRLKGLGEVEKNLLDDGITRFTIGGDFTTLNLANEHKDKVVAKGQDDAFVTAIYKGKRVYLEELIEQGILKE
ncbi:MAG: PD40 domain-containing protein [Flavobacteriales bacterium]|nr:PD40 domain-containing protein [Flavobacteriales bacterium]